MFFFKIFLCAVFLLHIEIPYLAEKVRVKDVRVVTLCSGYGPLKEIPKFDPNYTVSVSVARAYERGRGAEIAKLRRNPDSTVTFDLIIAPPSREYPKRKALLYDILFIAKEKE